MVSSTRRQLVVQVLVVKFVDISFTARVRTNQPVPVCQIGGSLSSDIEPAARPTTRQMLALNWAFALVTQDCSRKRPRIQH